MVNRLKQSTNPTPFKHSPIAKKFKLEDHVEAFTSGRKEYKLMNVEQKRALLTRFLNKKDQLEAAASLLKNSNSTGNEEAIKTFMDQLPKNKTSIKRAYNEHLAQKIILLSYPSKIILDFLRQQAADLLQLQIREYEKKHQRITNRTCSFEPGPIPSLPAPSEMEILLEEIVDLMDKIEEMTEKLYREKIKLPEQPGLTVKQASRVYDSSRVPQEQCYQICLFCNHCSTNLPTENDTVTRENASVMSMFNLRLDVWAKFEEQKKKNANAPFPMDPFNPEKEMRQRPSKQGERYPIIQCMCKMSRCANPCNDVGSSCPIKCVNPSNGKRYEPKGPGSDCPCPVCSCPCNQAVFKHLFVETAQKLKEASEYSASSSSQTTKSNTFDKNSANNAIGSAFVMATEEAVTNVIDFVKEQTCSSSMRTTKKQKNDMFLQTKERYCEEMARSLAKNGTDQFFDLSQKNHFKTALGSTTTSKLPTGLVVDTRAIGMNTDQHAKNNRFFYNLTKNEDNKHVFPGMQSNLIPCRPGYNTLEAPSPLRNGGEDTIVNLVSPRKDTNNDTNDEGNNDVHFLKVTNNNDKKRKLPSPSSHSFDNTESKTKIAWKLMKKRNAEDMFFNKKEKNMSKKEKKLKERAQKVGRDMITVQKNGEIEDILGLIGIDDENASQTSSSEILRRYKKGHMDMSDTDFSDSEHDSNGNNMYD